MTENIRRTFLENLKPAVKRAVAETTENEKDDSSSEDEESNEETAVRKIATKKTAPKKRVRRREREQVMKVAVIKRAEKGEGSIDEVQEQEELMTVEQAELMEQYRNDFFRQF